MCAGCVRGAREGRTAHSGPIQETGRALAACGQGVRGADRAPGALRTRSRAPPAQETPRSRGCRSVRGVRAGGRGCGQSTRRGQCGQARCGRAADELTAVTPPMSGAGAARRRGAGAGGGGQRSRRVCGNRRRRRRPAGPRRAAPSAAGRAQQEPGAEQRDPPPPAEPPRGPGAARPCSAWTCARRAGSCWSCCG